MTKTLIFTNTLKAIPVILDDKHYALQELTGTLRSKHINKLTEGMEIDGEGKPRGKLQMQGRDDELLKDSLFNAKLSKQGDEYVVDEVLKPAGSEVIASLNSEAYMALVKKAREISKFNEGDEDKAKNDE